MSERKQRGPITSAGRRNIQAAAARRRMTLTERLNNLGAGEALDVSSLSQGKAARKIKTPSGSRLTKRHTKYGGLVNGHMVVSNSPEALAMAYEQLGLSSATARDVWAADRDDYQAKLQAQYARSDANKANYRKARTAKIGGLSAGTAARYKAGSVKTRRNILSGRTAVLKSAGSVPASSAL